MSMLLLISCASENQTAICEATQSARDRLTVDLLADGGARSITSGATLLNQLDEGCK